VQSPSPSSTRYYVVIHINRYYSEPFHNFFYHLPCLVSLNEGLLLHRMNLENTLMYYISHRVYTSPRYLNFFSVREAKFFKCLSLILLGTQTFLLLREIRVEVKVTLTCTSPCSRSSLSLIFTFSSSFLPYIYPPLLPLWFICTYELLSF